MEKLIELLNESAVLDTIFENEYQVKFRATKIISKELGFIKWLIDNNKIDLNKLEKIWYEKIVYEYDWQYKEIVEYSDYESLLMLLAIQNEPIEFLISVLK